MCDHRNRWAYFMLALAFLVFASISCSWEDPFNLEKESVVQTIPIGYCFIDRSFGFSEGDEMAPNHLFLHKYPMPDDGVITDVIYLADSDELPEIMTLLILRPDENGWKVIHRVSIPDDDIPSSTRGLVTFAFASPLPVREGDIFAHWQPAVRATGPIPLNGVEDYAEGLSMGRAGFEEADLEVGQIISEAGFSGSRDYALNLILQTDPSK